MTTLRFSIIVPVYNAESYLEECINSVINQQYSNWELILIDDGSNDRSSFICDHFSKSSNKIKVIHQKNQGQFVARKNGVFFATGSHLVFLDSDDLFEFDALSALEKVILDRNPDLVLYDSYHLVNGEKRNAPDNIDFCDYITENRSIIEQCFLKRTSRISMCAYCFKKKLFSGDLEVFNFLQHSRSQEDFLMVYSIIRNAKSLYILNKKLYNYRFNPESTSHNLSPESFYDGMRVSSLIYNDIVHKYSFAISKDFDNYIFARLSWLPVSYLIRFANANSAKKLKMEFKKVKNDFLFENFTNHFTFTSKPHRLFIIMLKMKFYTLAKIIAKKAI